MINDEETHKPMEENETVCCREICNVHIGIAVAGCTLLSEVLWGFLWFCVISPGLTDASSYDLQYYVLTLVLALVFILIYWHLFAWIAGRFPVRGGGFLRKKTGKSIIPISNREFIVSSLLLLAVIGLVFICGDGIAYRSLYYLPWHDSAYDSIMFLSMVVLTWVLAYLLHVVYLRKAREKESGRLYVSQSQIRQLRRAFMAIFSLVLAAFTGWMVYSPNCFDVFTEVWHQHAYFNSIYRVLQFQPYSELNTGIYGFYGILIAPLVRLLGGNLYACSIALGLAAAIGTLGYYYALDAVTSNTMMRVCGRLAIAAAYGLHLAAGGAVYWQMLPHKVWTGGVVLALIIWRHCHRDSRKFWRTVVVLLMLSYSLIWNLETGVACVTAYAGSEAVYYLQRSRWKDRILWKHAFGIAAQMAAAVVFSYVFVNAYNYMAGGGRLSLEAILFPLLQGSLVSDISISLQTSPAPWMLVIALIIAAALMTLASTTLCGKGRQEEDKTYLSAAALMAAVLMTYYVNRSVYGNLFILLPAAVVMMGGVWEILRKYGIWDRKVSGMGILQSVQVMQTVLLVALSVVLISCSTRIIEVKQNDFDMTEVEELMDYVSANIPENTLGIGVGVPEIYSYLGWETGYYGIDISDYSYLSDEKKLEVTELVKSSNSILLTSRYVDLILGDYADAFCQEFHEGSRYDLECGLSFIYYVRADA